MPSATEAVITAFNVILAVADVVRESGTTPAGPVYAALAAKGMSLQAFEKVIGTLQSAKLVRRDGDLLVWVGPTK